MKGRKDIISVKPEVFEWLRESAGYSLEEVSKIIGRPIKIEDRDKPKELEFNITELRRLAKEFRRQFVCFLLDEVPESNMLEEKKIYYRSNTQTTIRKYSYESKIINLANRKARYLQSIIQDIIKKKVSIPEYNIDDDPELIGNKEREEFTLRSDNAVYKTPKDRFNSIRRFIEDKGIYVFKFSLPLDVIRGFSLVERPYIIVINSKDTIKGKIFTLLHEYAHILVRESAYCYLDIDNDINNNNNNRNGIEVWCNRFAAAFLMPLSEISYYLKENSNKEPRVILEELSELHGVSKLAMAVRLLNLAKRIKIQPELEEYIKNNIDDIREKAKESIKNKDDEIEDGEIYLFTWEDIPTDYHIEIKTKYPELYRLISKKLKNEDINLYAKRKEMEIIITAADGNEVANIVLKNRVSVLHIIGKEYKFKVKVEDNKHHVYKRSNIPPPINRKKSELGRLMEELIYVYKKGEIEFYDLADYLDINPNYLNKLIENE